MAKIYDILLSYIDLNRTVPHQQLRSNVHFVEINFGVDKKRAHFIGSKIKR